jgi:hypothetical protein
MKTRLTLGNYISTKLKESMKRIGRSFKETMGFLLRNGLKLSKKSKSKPFKVYPKNLKPLITVDYDNIGELIEQIEGPLHR